MSATPGSSPVYDRIGRSYPSTRRADPVIVASLARLLGAPRDGARCLDVGCGAGRYTRALSAIGGAWHGVDVSAVMLAHAADARSDVRWLQARAEALPFPDATFDGAVSTLVIHHYAGLDAPFAEVRRVLRGGARYVVLTAFPEQMRAYWLGRYFPGMMSRSIARMPDRDRVVAALRSAGFRSVSVVPYAVTGDLVDLFLYAGKHRPRLYLDAAVRANISSFAAHADEGEVAAGLAALERDLSTGAFTGAGADDGGQGDYAFVVACAA